MGVLASGEDFIHSRPNSTAASSVGSGKVFYVAKASTQFNY